MQIPKPLIANVVLLIFGVSIGYLISINTQSTRESGISVYESEVQKSMDLLAELSNGGPELVKHHLESSFKISLKRINMAAKEESLSGQRAKVVQQVVSKWRSDNSAMSLDTELSKEIQNASSQKH